MSSKPLKLKKISRGQIKTFKVRNRRSYAAICLNNLTEGSTTAQAVARLKNPLKRMGYCL